MSVLDHGSVSLLVIFIITEVGITTLFLCMSHDVVLHFSRFSCKYLQHQSENRKLNFSHDMKRMFALISHTHEYLTAIGVENLGEST